MLVMSMEGLKLTLQWRLLVQEQIRTLLYRSLNTGMAALSVSETHL